MNEMVVTRLSQGNCYILYAGNRAQVIITEPESRYANVYLGSVERIVPNIRAAFVRIGADDADTGFLPLNEIPEDAVCYRRHPEQKGIGVGDILLVQVAAQEEPPKKPRLKCGITMTGKYLVVTLGRRGVGVSRQLPQATRTKLSRTFTKAAKEAGLDITRFGYLIRTEAGNGVVPTDEMIAEAQEFTERIDAFCALSKSDFRALNDKCPSLLYSRPHTQTGLEHLLKLFHFCQRAMYRRPRIVVTSEALRTFVSDSGFSYMHPEVDVVVASDPNALDNRAKDSIREALSVKVALRSGANLIIERTQAFTAIDVNTAKAVKGGRTYLAKICREAAEEAMRQIRLRNLSGTILIDFPDLTPAQAQSVLKRLQALSQIDISSCEAVDITPLSIAELVRTRSGKPLDFGVL